MIAGFCATLMYIHAANTFIKYVKYIEWTSCTPLMVYELCIMNSVCQSTKASCIVMSTAFCICGTIAAVNHTIHMKTFLGVQGILYSIVVLYQLWKESFATAGNRLSIAQLIITSAVWPLYVVCWGSGPDVFMIITLHQETMIYMIVGVVFKTASTFLVVRYSESTNVSSIPSVPTVPTVPSITTSSVDVHSRTNSTSSSIDNDESDSNRL
jgi:bacteriorhodopsin